MENHRFYKKQGVTKTSNRNLGYCGGLLEAEKHRQKILFSLLKKAAQIVEYGNASFLQEIGQANLELRPNSYSRNPLRKKLDSAKKWSMKEKSKPRSSKRCFLKDAAKAQDSGIDRRVVNGKIVLENQKVKTMLTQN